MKNNLTFRIFSATVALIILFLAIYYGRETGIFIVALFCVFRGSFEIARLFFQDKYPKFAKPFFVGLCLSVFSIITFDGYKSLAGILIVLAFVLVVSVGILLHRLFNQTDDLLAFVTKCMMGLVYTCYVPATIVWMTQTNMGLEWFLCLLAVVFAGDIGAYVFGSLFGKTKIAPLLSPKKSVQGGLGGLFFSILAALGFSYFLPNTPFFVLFFCGLFGGLLGQIGDFFESLVKRVAGVKDSGSKKPSESWAVNPSREAAVKSSEIFFVEVI